MRAWRKSILIFCFAALLLQQQVSAQSVLAPVENYVVNRAIGGIIANRIMVARGIAANDATWLATAANDPVYKATMLGLSRSLTAANVASTALGVGLAIAGAPVWMTIAASLGVLAIGSAVVAGNTKIEVVSSSSGNLLRVMQPTATANPLAYSTTAINIPSMALGAQIYRDASCFTSETNCMYFPLLPTNAQFPYRWKPYPYDTGQWMKLWAVAYTFEQMKRLYLTDLTGGDAVFDRSGSNGDWTACYSDIANMNSPCTLTRATSWFIEPYWEFNSAGVARLVGGWRSEFTMTPDNPANSSYPFAMGYNVPTQLSGLIIDPAVQPIAKSNLEEIVPTLSSEALAQPVSTESLAKIADAAWRNAAAQPGYEGLPYTASNPVTAQEVDTWAQANSTAVPKLDDMLRPATNQQMYPNGVPISHTISYVPSTTSPGTSGNVNVMNTPNVNVVNVVKVDFGTDPGTADPTLESPPTGAQILSPLTSLFPEFRTFHAPAHGSNCPKPVFDVFGKTLVMDSHCTIAEQHRAALASIMMAVWLLVGLFILLSA